MIELVTADAQASIDPERGGRLAGLRVRGLEIMDQGRAPQGQPAGFYGGSFPMAPFAGFIPEAPLRALGATMALNVPDGASHGLVYDQPWTVESVSDTVAELRCRIESGWLATGDVRQRFALTKDSLHMQLAFQANRPVPASLGFHPWFRRDLGAGPVQVLIEPGRVRGFDPHGMPADFLSHPPEHPWDHFVGEVTRPPVLRWPELELTLESNTTAWIVYEKPDDAVCVEPVTAAPSEVVARQAVASNTQPLTLEFSMRWAEPAPRQPEA